MALLNLLLERRALAVEANDTGARRRRLERLMPDVPEADDAVIEAKGRHVGILAEMADDRLIGAPEPVALAVAISAAGLRRKRSQISVCVPVRSRKTDGLSE